MKKRKIKDIFFARTDTENKETKTNIKTRNSCSQLAKN